MLWFFIEAADASRRDLIHSVGLSSRWLSWGSRSIGEWITSDVRFYHPKRLEVNSHLDQRSHRRRGFIVRIDNFHVKSLELWTNDYLCVIESPSLTVVLPFFYGSEYLGDILFSLSWSHDDDFVIINVEKNLSMKWWLILARRNYVHSRECLTGWLALSILYFFSIKCRASLVLASISTYVLFRLIHQLPTFFLLHHLSLRCHNYQEK